MRATPFLLAATVLLGTRVASADDTTPAASFSKTESTAETKQEHPSLLDRPHTVAEAEAGIVALPSAPISPSNRGGSTPLGAVGNGDATVQTGVHILYRATREWAFGDTEPWNITRTITNAITRTVGEGGSAARSVTSLCGRDGSRATSG